MLQPLRMALGTLLSSSISLVGGLAMCLATSWRLSMLAFTSIFPVLVVTAVYAEWSSQLNREILSAMGDAMANATEALSNIRTVRSFSAEVGPLPCVSTTLRVQSEGSAFPRGHQEHEENLYELNQGIALKKGVKDAFGATGTTLLTSWANLSAGVLILWWGGAEVLSGGGRVRHGRCLVFPRAL